jgi:hypothetical protein
VLGVAVTPVEVYPSEPWSTYVPNLVVLCSTVAPVILLPDTATQSASVQFETGFAQYISCISERTVIFGNVVDLTKTRPADKVVRVGAPVKSTVN